MLSLDPVNLICIIINILVLFFLVKIFLFKPIDKMMAAREELLKKQFDEAEATRQKADELQRQRHRKNTTVSSRAQMKMHPSS